MHSKSKFLGHWNSQTKFLGHRNSQNNFWGHWNSHNHFWATGTHTPNFWATGILKTIWWATGIHKTIFACAFALLLLLSSAAIKKRGWLAHKSGPPLDVMACPHLGETQRKIKTPRS